jgi:hypothetical protein
MNPCQSSVDDQSFPQTPSPICKVRNAPDLKSKRALDATMKSNASKCRESMYNVDERV